MEAAEKNSFTTFNLSVLAGLNVIACLALGYVDYETHHISDLFTAQNLFALFLYFLPAYLLNLLFLAFYGKKQRGFALLSYSFVSGTLLGFTIAFIVLYWNLHR